MENHEKFIYDETSPTCLRHRFSRYLNNAEVIRAGETAGYLRFYKDGRPRNSCVSMAGRQEYLHRIVYIMHHGAIPEMCVIDHIDGNPHNNRISNLRAVRGEVNARNVKKHKSNTSGVTGVNLLQDRNGSLRWRAFWQEDGKMRSRTFSCNTYGYEEAKRKAIEFRSLQIQRLRNEGFDYSERHGT